MTTTQHHWTQLAARNTLIRELEELEEQKEQEIEVAVSGTLEQKIALLGSLQSYVNRINHLESQIYKFKVGQAVIRAGFSGTVVDRRINGDNSPEYVIESGTSGSRTLVNESNLRAK